MLSSLTGGLGSLAGCDRGPITSSLGLVSLPVKQGSRITPYGPGALICRDMSCPSGVVRLGPRSSVVPKPHPPFPYSRPGHGRFRSCGLVLAPPAQLSEPGGAGKGQEELQLESEFMGVQLPHPCWPASGLNSDSAEEDEGTG